MQDKMYNATELCEELGITLYALANWYRWEKYQIRDGIVEKPYLPAPGKLKNVKGRPKVWSYSMVLQLKKYQAGIIMGRNGKYGMYTNSRHNKANK